jgi:hypothetical protein
MTLVAHHFKRKDTSVKKPIHSKYAIVGAVLYISKTRAQWYMLLKIIRVKNYL